MQARKLELHVYDQSCVQDKFQTAIDVLHSCNLMENDCVETTCKDMC